MARCLPGYCGAQYLYRGLSVKPTTTLKTLLDFLQEAELDRVGAFTYSAVEGAPANARWKGLSLKT